MCISHCICKVQMYKSSVTNVADLYLLLNLPSKNKGHIQPLYIQTIKCK